MLVAINRNIIDKATEAVLTVNNGSFENVELSADELASQISKGYAFCAQHKSKWRCSQNFTGAGFLAVDVDDGLTLDAVQADNFYKMYASILYTTPSHTPTAHRFRVVFELVEPITDPESMKHALTGLIVRFGSDKSCHDPCRMFFGSSKSVPIVLANRLPASEVEFLILRGKESLVRTDSVADDKHTGRSAVRSRTSIPATTAVKTLDGTDEFLKDLPKRTRVYCPFHIDTRPSAFTLRNKRGNPGLYCSKCTATFFLDDGFGSSTTDQYQFDYRWGKLLSVSLDEWTANATESGDVNISQLRGVPIRELNDRYLNFETHSSITTDSPKDVSSQIPVDTRQSLVEDNPEIVLVKSPKGTGKTEWLKDLVVQKKRAKQSVLLIGHRRSLITATSTRIGLQSYLHFTEDGRPMPIFSHRVRHFAVCVDSLPNLDPRIDKYDVILIDEVEQVFSHLLSSTLKESRRSALFRLQHYLNSAKSMYLLDADLNSVTVEILDEMLDDRTRNCQVLVNTWQSVEKTLYLYDATKPNHLIGELSEALGRGERCFVCSNSKKLVEELEIQVRARSSQLIKSLIISSDNSHSPDIQQFIADIKTRILEYDVVFVSPALGTGIDITFPEDAQLVDTVFGFFRARINTHFDIDQQLSRVRNPKRINVWISPEKFQFETDAEAIEGELVASESEHRRLLKIAPDGTEIYDENNLYDKVFATVTAMERASKNNLRKHFIELRQSNGWTIEHVCNDKALGDVGKVIAKAGKDAQRQARFERTLMARQINTEEYEYFRKLDASEALKQADEPLMRRYEIEAFYRCDADMELLELDDENKLREAIRRYELVMAEDDHLKRLDAHDAELLRADKQQYLLKKRTLKNLFESAGIMRQGVFDTTIEVEAEGLDNFASEAQRDKTTIQRLFGIAVRRDVAKSPVRQLQELLRWLGLTLAKTRRDQAGNQSRVFYSLSIEHLDVLSRWAALRADDGLRTAWQQQREGDIEDQRGTELEALMERARNRRLS